MTARAEPVERELRREERRLYRIYMRGGYGFTATLAHQEPAERAAFHALARDSLQRQRGRRGKLSPISVSVERHKRGGVVAYIALGRRYTNMVTTVELSNSILADYEADGSLHGIELLLGRTEKVLVPWKKPPRRGPKKAGKKS